MALTVGRGTPLDAGAAGPAGATAAIDRDAIGPGGSGAIKGRGAAQGGSAAVERGEAELAVDRAGELAPEAAVPAIAAFGGAGGLAARDVQTFHRMLRGDLDVDRGLLLISRSGGWPIRTANGFIFADRGEGQSIALDTAGWKPQPMNHERGLSWIHLPLPGDLPARYKFVDARGEWRADPWSRNFAHDVNGEYSLTRPREGARFERWPMMTDGVVEPRALRVFIPGDARDITHHLYVHDGQTLFDPKGPHGSWRLHESTGPNTLVIGIDNTPARRHEYTHTRDVVKGEEIGGDAEKYADFIEKTVRPFIEARYGAARKVGLMGASLGGLVSYYQSVKYPESYDFVAGLSATMRWGKIGADQPTIVDLFRDRPRTRTVFYMDSGLDNYESNRQTADALAELGYRWEDQLFHWHEPNAEHTEKAWSQRVHRPLAIFESMK